MNKVKYVLLAIVLFLLPIIGRTAYFYRGLYAPPAIHRPNLADIEVPTPDMVRFTDLPKKAEAIVVFDFAHNNNYREAELNELWNRLTARGSRPEFLVEGKSLRNELRRAQSYVVISPRVPFNSEEIRYVKHFVDTGGKLMLVGDPTRFDVTFDPLGFPKERRSDVANINPLAAPLGLVFQDDYLYNMKINAGSYRDIVLRDFADSPLTAGLKVVTFFAAHSIVTTDHPLIMTDADTRSSLSEQQGNLAVAALTTDDRVLGLGDLTFLTDPYCAISDNDRLVSNIADFLVSGNRSYELIDFPYFFGSNVDLMYAGKKAVGGDVLTQAGALQSAFDAAGKKLTPRRSHAIERDSLYIGLYDGIEYVKDILSARGITITISANNSELTESPTATKVPTSVLTTTASPMTTETPSPGVSGISWKSSYPTGTPQGTLSPTPSETTAPMATATVTETAETPVKGSINIEDLGEFPTDSVTLLSLGNEKGHRVLIVLAATKESLAQALGMLTREDLAQCLSNSNSALCPANPSFPTPPPEVYVPPPEGELPTTTATPEFIRPIEPPVTNTLPATKLPE